MVVSLVNAYIYIEETFHTCIDLSFADVKTGSLSSILQLSIPYGIYFANDPTNCDNI